MSNSVALTANLLLAINRLADSFPIPNKTLAMQIENEALRIFVKQLQMAANTLGDSSNSLGLLISRKQRNIHFDADNQFKKINTAVTLNGLLVYQASIIIDANPQPTIDERSNILAGITSLQSISHELSRQINKLHNDVISVI
jgi:hypothetical protein